MKKKLRIVILLILIALLLAACQATPEKPVVIQKDLEQMIEKGMAGSAVRPTVQSIQDYSARCAYYGVPERFQTGFDKQDVEVHADVSIELPEMTALPMARVVAAKFPQEQIYALFHALCGDTPSNGSTLQFMRNSNDFQYGYQSGTQLDDVTSLSLSGGAIDDCMLQTTPRQAREVVGSLIEGAGLSDMIIDRVYLYSSKVKIMPADSAVDAVTGQKIEIQGPDASDINSGGPETQAYVFRLLRKLNGVKIESTQDLSQTCINEEGYGKEWAFESLTVAVDDEGIVNLFWMGPLDVVEVLTENTTTLSWSDIEGVFEKMMPIKYTPIAENNSRYRIDIIRISLSLQRIVTQDSFNEGLLIPVWNFYGKVSSTDEQGNILDHSDPDFEYVPLLSVNAIDGSIIDRGLGY